MVRNYYVAGVVADGKLKVLFSEDGACLHEALLAVKAGESIPPQTASNGDQVTALAREWKEKHGCSSFDLEEVGAVSVPIFGTLERTATAAA